MKAWTKVVAVAAVLILARASLFVVSEHEYCVLMRSGNPGPLVDSPGLHFNIPFLRKAVRFERRWMLLVLAPSNVATKDKTFLEVGAGTIWRISDPMLFLAEFGTTAAAEARIGAVIEDGLREELRERSLLEFVRLRPGKLGSGDTSEFAFIPDPLFDKTSFARAEMGRQGIVSRVRARTRESLDGKGIQIGDLYLSSAMYEASFLESVYKAMDDERRQLAKRIRKG